MIARSPAINCFIIVNVVVPPGQPVRRPACMSLCLFSLSMTIIITVLMRHDDIYYHDHNQIIIMNENSFFYIFLILSPLVLLSSFYKRTFIVPS